MLSILLVIILVNQSSYNSRILFGKGPGGWDSWDSWDGWDGWDSWDQQINRQLEAPSW